MPDSHDPTDWLLTKAERGNPSTRLDDSHPGDQAWSEGNLVRPLIHGATYFAELYERLEATRRRRPGALHRLAGRRRRAAHRRARAARSSRCSAAPTSAASTCAGWSGARTASALGFTSEENRRLGEQLQARGAEALLDMRVRTGGSHHQKLVVIRHRDDPTRDIAYVGGIDLCHSRRDDADHRGDPQAHGAWPTEYGDTPPWHDVQAAISGPAVHDVETVFRERWEDPTPLTPQPAALDRRTGCRGMDIDARPAARAGAAAAPGRGRRRTSSSCCGPTRTCGAAATTRSPAAASAASPAATPRPSSGPGSLIYVEDQYLWGHHVGDVFTEALRDHPDLHVIAVVPLFPDLDGRLGRTAAAARAGAGRCCEMIEVAPGPGGGLRHREPRRAPRSTCTPRSASSTTSGPRSAPTTSTAGRGPTTPSCPRSWSTAARRATPAGCG